jgi:hypothetical protein
VDNGHNLLFGEEGNGMKTIAGVNVNDGGGLLDSEGMCDSLVNDCNNLIKQAIAGQYIFCCDIIVKMVQKLAKLQKGIKDDRESKNKIIEELKRINDDLMEEKTGLPVDRGENNGSN